MNLYVITRRSAGYGELESATVMAETEDAARLLIIRANASRDGVSEFADPEYSTAVLISPDAIGVISQSFSAT